MRTTDRGLQKAIKGSPITSCPVISVTVCYKRYKRKVSYAKTAGKRMFILFLIFAILSGGSCIGFLYGNTEQPSSTIGTPVRKYFRTPIRSFSTCPRSVPSVCYTSSTDGYERKCIKQFKNCTILKRANIIRSSPFPFLYQSEILFPIAFQLFCLELTDEVEMLFYFRFSVVHIHIQ